MELQKPWDIFPLDITEGLAICNFHSCDLKGLTLPPSNAKLKKAVYLVPCKQSVKYQIHLDALGLKPCNNSLGYLLGLTYELQKKDVIPWGKYVVGIESGKSTFGKKKDLCITIDFSLKDFKRLTLAYIDEFFDERFLLLAENEL